MWTNMKFKTMKWEWVETLEEPVVKHIITREMLNASTLYGQITVRLHSKQVNPFLFVSLIFKIITLTV